uniref:SCP domain-containing protein n=1 Tax=Oryza barthii TaxID=65489 RepID=A0A0D3HX29_9ORYZ
MDKMMRTVIAAVVVGLLAAAHTASTGPDQSYGGATATVAPKQPAAGEDPAVPATPSTSPSNKEYAPAAPGVVPAKPSSPAAPAGVVPAPAQPSSPAAPAGVVPAPVQPSSPATAAPKPPSNDPYAPATSNTSAAEEQKDGLNEKAISDIVREHNMFRTREHVPPIVWNATLARYAQEYADLRRGDCQLEHSHGPYGENMIEEVSALLIKAAACIAKDCSDDSSEN